MATSRVAWGIDVGNRALKAIKLVREEAGVRIDDVDVIEHESVLSNAGDNREGLIQTALATFVGRHNTKGIPVAVGVSGQQSFARFIKLPPVEPKKIPEIVRFEAIQQIPFPLDEVEWSYQLFQDDTSPDVEVGIFAMRKDLVQEHIKFFTDAGLNVQAVQMNPLAVYNGLYFDDRLKGATTMIIDLGAENADLIITEGETIWMRSIPIGGNHFTEALVKSFKLRFEKAEELKRNAATSKYGRQILQAMRPIFADLVSEIQRSIGFYSSVHRDSRISRVIALGGTFKLPGLQKYLQQNLSLEVHKVDGLGQAPPTDAKVGTALNENILSAVSAYGLALQGMGEAKINSSLLPQQIRREKAWREKTKWFGLAAACMVVGVGIPVGRYYYEEYKYEQAKASRDTIQSVINTGKRMDTAWKGVESKGEPDRKLIADVNTLTHYRELKENIYKEIQGAFPAPVKPAAPNAPDMRVFLEEMQMDYQPNFARVLAMDDQQFTQFANTVVPKRDFSSTIDPRAGKRGAGATGGVGGQGLIAPAVGGGLQPFPGAVATPFQDPNAPAPAGGDQRGFLVTLHTVTPNPSGVNVINSTVVTTLLNRAKAQAAAPTTPATALRDQLHNNYRVHKVAIASALPFEQSQERMGFLAYRVDAHQKRVARASGVVPGAAGAGEQPQPIPIAPAAPAGAPAGAPLFPGATDFQGGALPAPGAPGAGVGPDGKPLVDIFVDPSTGESVKGWWDVVLLVSVIVEPPTAVPVPAPDQTQ